MLAERGGTDGGGNDGADTGSVRRSTRELLTLARRIGEPVAALCGPAGPADTEELARYGSTRVFAVPASTADECGKLAPCLGWVKLGRKLRVGPIQWGWITVATRHSRGDGRTSAVPLAL